MGEEPPGNKRQFFHSDKHGFFEPVVTCNDMAFCIEELFRNSCDFLSKWNFANGSGQMCRCFLAEIGKQGKTI